MNNFSTEQRRDSSWHVVTAWRDAGIRHGFGDASCDVSEGLAKWNAEVGAPEELRLVVAKQVHGSDIITIADSESISVAGEYKQREADAVIIAPGVPGVAAGALSADCTPVLIVHRGSGAVAACHCGWRGAVAELLPATIAEMSRQFGASSGFSVAIGPAASAECYEIGDDVAVRVRAACERCKKNCPSEVLLNCDPLQVRHGQTFCEIKQLLRLQSLAAGMAETEIFVHPACTISDTSFFSHRRQNGEAGRQVSFISAVPGTK